MHLDHQGRDKSGRIYSPSRIALFAAPALIAATLLINASLPTVAHSQINGRITAAPAVAAHAPDKPKLPKAPVQVAMPAAPPMKIFPGLEEPLVATGPETEEEGKALDVALKEFHDAPAKAGPQGDYADYAKPLLAFIDAHPKSNWNSALQLNLGLGYYHAGYFSRAFAAFDKSWQLGRNATDPHARLMVDRAVGELAKMHARVGHANELEALFRDIGNRPIGGPATELIQGAHEGLMTFRKNPGEGYLCGPNALRNVLLTLKAKPAQIKIAQDARSGPHGFSLTQLAALADKTGLKYTLVHRRPGEPIPVPSIINWKVHHYAAIVGMQDGDYHVMDPTFGDSNGLLVTRGAIDAESSGYFLVPQQAFSAKQGWQKVAAGSAEANSVYGMGNANAVMTGVETPCDKKIEGSCCGTSTCTPQGVQMTVANAHKMTVSLNLTDTPVGYRPQKGAPALTAITYNAREDLQPASFASGNVSAKWNHTWMAFIQDDPVHTAWSVSRIASGGGGYVPGGYNATTGQFAPEMPDNSILSRTTTAAAATSYTRTMPDGSKEIYATSDGATGFPRHMFLSSVVDSQGNTTTLNYDTSHRLTSVVDAMGRSTTFTYGLTGFPLLVTRITDPFGRTAQMTYDTSGRLASITDPIGITSSFTYSTTEPTFVKSLTTPYGTSTFSDAVNPNDAPETITRSLTLTDPMGFTDYLYFYQNPSITPASDPAATIPTGIVADNGLLEYRNTYYWDKHAFALGATMSGGVVQSEDFTKASLTHWLHQVGILDVSRTVGSTKKALERRVWYTYQNQAIHGAPYDGGILDKPIAYGRVLDDGTSQVTNITYNYSASTSGGLPTSVTDPKGRAQKYAYATNNIDLLTVQQLTTAPSTYTTVATFGSYNTLHEPQTYTDAAGKVWNFTYNAAGQKSSVTDPSGGVTTWNYDTNGRLSSIVNANSVTQASYTYDAADRVATYTDSEGYVLTYGYDNLDRITSITYPDGTTDLYDYNFQSGPFLGTPSLELRKHTDRLGRVTAYDYDADRRLISVTEPTSGSSTRTTSYSYYENGVMKELTDASGNVTHWDIDIEGRPTDKIYAFGTASAQTESYTYEAASGRLHTITDANGQVKTFAYDKDDRTTGITYTSAVNPTPGVTFTWDSLFPRLKSMADGLGTTSFAYTAIGTNGALKLASIDGPYGNDVIGLTYDALGRLAGRNITGGNETFGYDAISRLTTHGTPLGTFNYAYLGQTGQMASRSVTNGTVTVSTNWGYDTNTNDRRLISIANSGVTRSFTLGYGSGPVNPYDIMSITDTAATGHPFASQSHSYGYDNVDRLLSATSTTPGNYSYGYDNLDNATSVTDPAFGSISPTYNGLNQVTAFNTNTYSYDNNGNTTSDGLTKTYKWDAENRLIEVDYIGTTAKSQFSYDGLGHRTVDVETDALGGVTTTRYLWCGSRICQTRNGSDVVQSRILPEGELNVVSGQKAIYMPDQLGSVRDVIDATTGNLIASLDYSPYGKITQSSGTFSPVYQYAGLMFHTQSNLLFSATRALDQSQHWLSRDSITEAGGMNPYAYANAGPIDGTDAWGLLKVFIWRMAGGNAGHASVLLDNDTYISWWPKKDCGCKGPVDGPSNMLFLTGMFPEPAEPMATLQGDERAEGGPADTTITITGLNEGNIQTWWDNFQKSHDTYNPIFQNCATTAADALAAGGGVFYGLLGGGIPVRLPWTPSGVESFANSINSGLHRWNGWALP
jgi:RHS repeat-associated protein